MRPIEFDDQNVIMAKDQPEYLPLPAHKDASGVVTSCWILTGEEIQRVSETGILWLQVSTFNHSDSARRRLFEGCRLHASGKDGQE